MIDVSKLRRDKKHILSKFFHDKKAHQLIALDAVSIHFPARWVDGGDMGYLNDVANVACCIGIIADDAYANLTVVSNIPLIMNQVSEEMIEGKAYMVLSYTKGDLICPDMRLVKFSKQAYSHYNEIDSLGRNPWYHKHTDIPFTYDSAKVHAGVNIQANHAILESFSAIRCRNPKNPVEYWRESVKTQKEFDEGTPLIIQLNSVSLGATDTVSRLGGNYLPTGRMGSLTNQTEHQSNLDALVRA